MAKIVSVLLGAIKLHLGIKRMIIGRINKQLSTLLIFSEGLKSLVSEYDIQRAKQELPFLEKTLSYFRDIYSDMEQVNFFKNKETELILENILLNFYQIEGELKHKDFTGENSNDDKSLQSFASNLSLASLPA